MDGSHLSGPTMVNAVAVDLQSIVGAVVDPEIPVLTIEDLGILRSVEVVDDGVVVTITPTYSGCPALDQISGGIKKALIRAGAENVEVNISHQETWTTDWITEEGHRKLRDFGIAPPTPEIEVLCPQCESQSPRMIARFGSTACKALMVCSSCGEPFDYFKMF